MSKTANKPSTAFSLINVIEKIYILFFGLTALLGCEEVGLLISVPIFLVLSFFRNKLQILFMPFLMVMFVYGAKNYQFLNPTLIAILLVVHVILYPPAFIEKMVWSKVLPKQASTPLD